MRHIFETFVYFYVYSFIGWTCESIYCSIGNQKFINRGFLNGPLCPIYGIGALVIIYLLKDYKNNRILLFLYGLIITSIIEYVGGYLLEKIFNARWWDYSNQILNINGRVCLRNSILFGILCVILMQVVHPIISKYVGKIPDTSLIVLILIITIIFSIDLIFTVNAINKLNNKLRGLDNIIIDISKISGKLQDNLYTQKINLIREKSFMQRRIFNAFPNMKHNNRHEQLKLVIKIIKGKIN